MSTALATQQPPRRSALVTMAARLNVEEGSLLKTLKDTVCKGCSDSEVMAFSVVANEYELNPFIKQIYAFPAKGGGIVPVVSVDGWVAMVNNHPQMDGMEFDYHKSDAGKLEAITCTIWRKDRTRPIKVTEILDECRRPTDPWKMENRMLRHKALMQCARYAFGFSGLHDEDEAEDMRNITPQTPATPTKPASTNPFADPEPADQGEKPVIDAKAEVMPQRDEMIICIRTAIGAAGLKNVEAFEIFRSAGVIQAADPQDASDAELYAITQRLDLIPPKEKEEPPAGEEQPAAPAETSKADKKAAEEEERATLMNTIHEAIAEWDEMTIAKFEACCRIAAPKKFGATASLKSVSIATLRVLAGNAGDIIKAGREGGVQ